MTRVSGHWQTYGLGSARSEQGEGMTYYEAAIEVLRAAKDPLTAKEITKRAIEKGLITPSGKTPVATMKAVLYLRLPNDSNLVKLEDQANGRAKSGSVRWTLARN